MKMCAKERENRSNNTKKNEINTEPQQNKCRSTLTIRCECDDDVAAAAVVVGHSNDT